MANSGTVTGIILCLIGNLSMNLGTNIVKVAHNKRQTEALNNPNTVLKPLWKSKVWRVGAVVFKSGNLLNFIAYGLGPQSVLAAMSGVQFVSNAIFARIILKERASPRMYVGIFGIVAGILMLVLLFGNQSSGPYTSDDLVELFGATPFLCYLSLIFTLAAVAYVTSRLYKGKTAFPKEKLRRVGLACLSSTDGNFSRLDSELDLAEMGRKGTRGEPADHNLKRPAKVETVAPNSAVSGGAEDSSSPASSTQESGNADSAKPHHKGMVLPFCYAFFSAVPGTQSITFSKMCSVLLRETVEGDNQLVYPFTYFCILVFVVTGILWDKQLNQGLRKFDALIITPVLQANFTLLAILNGGIFFQEFNSLQPEQVAAMIGAITLVIGSMFLLVPNSPDLYSEGETLAALEALDTDTVPLSATTSLRSEHAASDQGPLGAEVVDVQLVPALSQDLPLSDLSGLGGSKLSPSRRQLQFDQRTGLPGGPPTPNPSATPMSKPSKVQIPRVHGMEIEESEWDASSPVTPDADDAFQLNSGFAKEAQQHEVSIAAARRERWAGTTPPRAPLS
ncbi:hypothetical protein CYMTET_33233 [Cymbomonas tetramitiformis]|uniref:Probable magnesium transporter n=1 Tax=Cymbomonas tetramitiformis TaxID=36881 RepID=A0AAE0FDJ3_9CHLO|nr:hypothetical protein CYMTET_33233 [Cymbomonas tetramitiformis]